MGLTLRKPSCRPPCAGPPPCLRCPRAAIVCPPTPNTNRYASTPDMRVLRCVSSLAHTVFFSLVVLVVVIAVVLLLVTVVCKRACDRLSYTMLVTSSRRTLRYLVREGKRERERESTRACACARTQPIQGGASSFLNVFNRRHRNMDIFCFLALRSRIGSKLVEMIVVEISTRSSPVPLVVPVSLFSPVIGKLFCKQGHPVYVSTKSAQPAGRRTCVRWRARISARPNASRMRARPSNTTRFDRDRFFSPFLAAERVRSGDVDECRELDGTVRKTIQQQVTSTSVGNRVDATPSAGPPTPVFVLLARLSACLLARPSARGVIPLCSRRLLCFRDASVRTGSAAAVVRTNETP